MEGIQTLKGSWPWPWPWIRPYGIPSCITHRPLPTYTKFHSNRKNFLWTDGRTDVRTDGRTDGRTFFPSNIIRSTFGSRPNNLHQFLFTTRRLRKRGLCCRPVSVCMSVCPFVCSSVTLVHCIQTAKDSVKLITQPGSSIILVFWPHRRYPIPKATPSAGRKIQGGGKILRFSTEISVYLGNGTR